MTAMRVDDQFGRPLRNLRQSVVDRCNLRCQYCMPEQEYVWLPKHDILTFEEIGRLVDVFAELGVDKIRLTGGEPLLRRNLRVLVSLLAAKSSIRDLALTTNGVLLAEHAAALKEAGLRRLTVSLDTLRPERFRQLMQRDMLAQVLEGIEAARSTGLGGLKIDSVIIRNCNDDELLDLLEYGRSAGAEVRFIEYMDVGGATRWSIDQVVSRAEMLERIAARYGAVEPLRNEGSAPADRFRLPDGYVFGIISSTTEPFCRNCDRSRLTADGMWLRCLYAKNGTDLRGPLRAGASVDQLKQLIAPAWRERTDKGAEDRLQLRARAALFGPDELRRDPHLEMHTRGG
jgi:cyclic pyranopterin phosphate synthase